MIQITVNTTKELALQLRIFAYLEGQNETNATSNLINIFVINNVTTEPVIDEAILNKPP